jgi:type 1 glutamine amidotransferase
MNKFCNLFFNVALILTLIPQLRAEDCCGQGLNYGVINTLDEKEFLNKSSQVTFASPAPQSTKALKALLIAGGCCHDYALQTKILSKGIQERANIQVDITWTRDQDHNTQLPIFKNPDWAKGYDLIIHDECAAMVKDETILNNILKVHETVPAVHLHCAIHSFRGSDNQWHEHIGLSSTKHGPHVPIAVELVEPKHPIVANLENWVTDKEELYNNAEVYGATPIAMGTQKYKRGKDEIVDKAIVAWVNTKHGAPSFSTSMGHFNHNVEDPRYLNLVTRGALWACGKLDQPSYQQAYKGLNSITEMEFITSLKVSAQSTQDSKLPALAIDDNPNTRWCASSATKPSWFQIQFLNMTSLTAIEIDWEIKDQWMQYTIETSRDGKKWSPLVDASKNTHAGTRKDKAIVQYMRYMRINILGQENDMWPSIREIRFFDYTGTQLNLKNK